MNIDMAITEEGLVTSKLGLSSCFGPSSLHKNHNLRTEVNKKNIAKLVSGWYNETTEMSVQCRDSSLPQNIVYWSSTFYVHREHNTSFELMLCNLLQLRKAMNYFV